MDAFRIALDTKRGMGTTTKTDSGFVALNTTELRRPKFVG